MQAARRNEEWVRSGWTQDSEQRDWQPKEIYEDFAAQTAFVADEPKQNVVERHGEFEKQEICHTPWEKTNAKGPSWKRKKHLQTRQFLRIVMSSAYAARHAQVSITNVILTLLGVEYPGSSCHDDKVDRGISKGNHLHSSSKFWKICWARQLLIFRVIAKSCSTSKNLCRW